MTNFTEIKSKDGKDDKFIDLQSSQQNLIKELSINSVKKEAQNSLNLEKSREDLCKFTIIKNIENSNLWNYIPISSYVSINDLKLSSKLAIKQYDESIYLGEIENNKRHGIGFIKYNNGRIYEGNWKNNLRDGKGFEKF